MDADLRISVLVENHSGHRTRAEHGLSYLVETDGKRILFDTGQSDLFQQNATLMNIDLANIDIVVLSHGHFDHGNGLPYIPGKKLICHPGCFVRRHRRSDRSYIGLGNTKDEISSMFDLVTSVEPCSISDRVLFLGEIPRVTDFESKKTSFIFEDGTPDFVMDDSAIAMILHDGLFIVTGCGHAGIVNTFEHARITTGIGKLFGLMGGFHLKEADLQLNETIRYLRGNKVSHIFPSHCTELPALASFYENFRIGQVRTGDIMKF